MITSESETQGYQIPVALLALNIMSVEHELVALNRSLTGALAKALIAARQRGEPDQGDFEEDKTTRLERDELAARYWRLVYTMEESYPGSLDEL